MEFRLQAQDGHARAGVLVCAHGQIQTPVFMPVGTQASVKALDFCDLLGIGFDIILANTYHLYLRPGHELIQKLGGLHGFCKYPKNFLTDSGGFQAFSLASCAKVSDEGIVFKSHIDGSKHLFTPQKVLDIQYHLNSDIMMVLDDLVGLPAPKERVYDSICRTTKWAQQAITYHNQKKHQIIQEQGSCSNHIFAINQGGIDEGLRQMSARDLTCMGDFDGYAIGGLAVGESHQAMYDTLEFVTPLLPKHKPRYLMGVGTPRNIVEAIWRGVDMFDCVMPTRNARNATLFTKKGKLSIKSACYKSDERPVDEHCDCFVCKHHSRAYLHHLFKAHEIAYFRLASIHNLSYYHNLIQSCQRAIKEQRFGAFYKEFCSFDGN